MTLSPGPPPWPIPPSWPLPAPSAAVSSPPEPGADADPEAPPEPARPPVAEAPAPDPVPQAADRDPMPPAAAIEPVAAEPQAASGPPSIALLVPDGAGRLEILGAVAGVTVDAKPLPAPARGFAGVYELAAAVTESLEKGADGVVLVQGADALEETAWALELLHASDAPLVLAANPGQTTDVADAVNVAASVPRGAGCLIVSGGEIHLARHSRGAGAQTPVPSAGPLGYVTAGTVRLLWNPPERLTLSGERAEGRTPRVGLHTATLGDDGELLVALAERCDGLVVTATTTGGVPDEIADVLTEAANRIPVVLVSLSGHDSLPVTTLHPLKARVLMHLLLATGRDRDAVLDAFTAAARPGTVRL